MTHLEKQENKLNNLYKKIKELPLSEEDKGDLNIKGFLYSVSRLNILQIVAYLTNIALTKKIPLEEIIDLLK